MSSASTRLIVDIQIITRGFTPSPESLLVGSDSGADEILVAVEHDRESPPHQTTMI
jgi:hypothetical protein